MINKIRIEKRIFTRSLKYPIYKYLNENKYENKYEYRGKIFSSNYNWNYKMSYEYNIDALDSEVLTRCKQIDIELDVDRTGEESSVKALDDFFRFLEDGVNE